MSCNCSGLYLQHEYPSLQTTVGENNLSYKMTLGYDRLQLFVAYRVIDYNNQRKVLQGDVSRLEYSFNFTIKTMVTHK
jgi:hypothetical protein